MNLGLVYSIILHAIIIVVILFGLPRFFDSHKHNEISISMDILPIKDSSNVPNIAKKKPVNNKPDEAKTIVKAARDKPEDKAVPKENKEIVKKEPEKTKEEPKKEEIKKEKIKPEEPKKPEPKKEPEKNKETKEKPKVTKQEDDLDYLQKSLEDNADKKTDKATKNNKANIGQDNSDKTSKSDIFDPSKDLSISEHDNIKRQIQDMWELTRFSGSKDAEKMTVTLKVTIEKDGTVTAVKHVGGNDNGNKAVYNIVVETAILAVQKASPIQNLNQNNYNAWHQLEMNFDPRELMNIGSS